MLQRTRRLICTQARFALSHLVYFKKLKKVLKNVQLNAKLNHETGRVNKPLANRTKHGPSLQLLVVSALVYALQLHVTKKA
jgi:hypothetical protein